MPEEILIIIVMSIFSVTLLSIVGHVRKYLEAKNGIGTQSGKGNSSMTTSELEKMMARAVDGAIRPLVKRMENVEAAMSDEDLPDLLTEADSYFESDLDHSKIKVTRGEKGRRL